MATETQTQKPKLKDFVYEFQSNKKGQSLNLNSKSKIFLVIDGKETDIPIEKLFLKKPEIDSDDIMGYSILEMLTDNTKLKIDDNTTLDIRFIDKDPGTEFYISKKRRPMFYNDDIEVTVEKRLEYIDLLLSTVSRNSEPSVNAETPEEAAAREAAAIKAVEDAKAVEEANKAAEIKAAEEAQTLKEQEEKEEAARMVLGGIGWQEEHDKRILEGLTEYQSGDFRFFYKPAVDNQDAIIGMYFLEPGEFYVVDLYEEEITEELETYTFEDGEGTEYVTLFNKKDNTLSVEEAKVDT